MANVKEVEIRATLPWDWASRLPDSESALFAGLFLNPVIGLQISQVDKGYVDNATGGRTSTFEVTITGQEALAFPMLDRLVAALATVGPVTEAWVRDVEDDSEWASLVKGG